jgi:hypothetical protein
MSNGVFDKQPGGIDGLRVLVTAHPQLEANLINLLESLPTEKLGPWVVQGWDSVIKDSANVTRLNEQLEKWSNVSDNQALKTAASGTLAIRRKR